MPRYAQLVMGPAGCGKSTYCSTMVRAAESLKRTLHVVNIDPAAEHFSYQKLADIRDLIELEDAMNDKTLNYGPNGGLVFCMEYFTQNFDWLKEELEEVDDDYILFDCPGQIELFTHVPVMKLLVDQLQSWDFRVCGVFIADSQFLIEPSKFVFAVMTALSTMINLEIPFVNVMSKLDLLSNSAKKSIERYLEPDMVNILSEEFSLKCFNKTYESLNHSIANIIDDYSLVRFLPLDITNEDMVEDVLFHIDLCIQYGEDFEPKQPKDFGDDDRNQENNTMQPV